MEFIIANTAFLDASFHKLQQTNMQALLDNFYSGTQTNFKWFNTLLSFIIIILLMVLPASRARVTSSGLAEKCDNNEVSNAGYR